MAYEGMKLHLGLVILMALLLPAPLLAREAMPAVGLAQSEAMGGHTLARHVARSEAQLRDRLLREPRIPAAGAFATREDAEAVVAEALQFNAAAIARWLPDAPPGATRGFSYNARRTIGAGVIRANDALEPMRRVRLVLRRAEGAAPYFVLTAYPVP